MLTALVDSGVRWGEFCELRGRDLKTGPNGPYLAVRRAWDAKTKNGRRAPRAARPATSRSAPSSPAGYGACNAARTSCSFRARR